MESRIDQAYSLTYLINDIESGRLNDSFVLQRDADQFNDKQKSLLIDSVLRGVIIKPITIMQKGTGDEAECFLADGKQRVTTFVQFKHNEFKLSKTVKPIKIKTVKMIDKVDENGKVVKEILPGKKRRTAVKVPAIDENGNKIYEMTEVKLANKTYSDLPPELQDRFNRYNKMPAIYMINCTTEEIRLQMIRDNISAKMNPAQIGTIVSGEKIAEFTRSFRRHNLFMNQLKWDEKIVKKDAIEKCITETYVLLYMTDKWGQYAKNVDLLRNNATEGTFEEMRTTIDRLSEAIKGHPLVYENLNAKNMRIVIANFKEFIDSEQYEDSDYGLFLEKWFETIKDESDCDLEKEESDCDLFEKAKSDYNLFEKVKGTPKSSVYGMLETMSTAVNYYMENYGTRLAVVEEDEDICEEDGDISENDSIDADNNEASDNNSDDNMGDDFNVKASDNTSVILDSSFENALVPKIGFAKQEDIMDFNIKTLMISSDYKYNDFEETSKKEFIAYFNDLSQDEKDNIVEDAGLYTSCANAYISEQKKENDFADTESLLAFLSAVKKAVQDDIADDVINEWLNNFDVHDVCGNKNIVDKIAYMCDSLGQYQVSFQERKAV